MYIIVINVKWITSYFVDDGDTVELITVEVAVQHSADPEMIKIICNILLLQTEISNFNIIYITDNV